jgi:formylglycine-generating enzyme required for sulfatase activity
MAFALKLKDLTGSDDRLPTGVEWTYACCAGTPTTYFHGDSETELEKFAWYHENSGGRTHPVGEKSANKWGLHDMVGNVEEWCSESPQDEENDRYIRGGSWDKNPEFFKAHNWFHAGHNDSGPDIGFRLIVGAGGIK